MSNYSNLARQTLILNLNLQQRSLKRPAAHLAVSLVIITYFLSSSMNSFSLISTYPDGFFPLAGGLPFMLSAFTLL